MRVVWTSPPLGLARSRLRERCRELIEAEGVGACLVLVPTRALARVWVEAIVPGAGLCGRPRVFLLDELASWVLEEAAAETEAGPLPKVDAPGLPLAEALAGRLAVLLAREGRLPALGRLAEAPSFGAEAMRLIAEVERAGLEAEGFRAALERRRALDEDAVGGPGEPRLIDQDLSELYGAYEAALSRLGLTDSVRQILRAREALAGVLDARPVALRSLERLRLLVLDAFFDFPPAHWDLALAVAARAGEVKAIVEYDRANPHACRALLPTLERYERAGFEVASDPGRMEVAPKLSALAGRLFSPAPAPARVDPPRLVRPADRASEAAWAAKAAKRLVRQGLEPTRIAVVVRDASGYAAIAREAFAREGVALEWPRLARAGRTGAARAAARLVETAARRTRGLRVPVSRLAATASTGYFDFGVGEAGCSRVARFVGAELGLAEWRLRASRVAATLLSVPVRERPSGAPTPEEIERAGRLFEAVDGALARLAARARASEHAVRLPELLELLGFRTRLEAALARAETKEDFEAAALDLRAASAVEAASGAVFEVARAAALALGRPDAADPELTLSEFAWALASVVREAVIASGREGGGGVRLVAPEQLRGLELDAVLSLGLLEGETPAPGGGDWIYPQSERDAFALVGLALEDLGSGARLEREEYEFWQTLARARRVVLLSAPLSGERGEEAAPSPFLAEVAAAAGVDALESEFVTGPGDPLAATSGAELAEALAAAGAWDGRDGTDPLWARLTRLAVEIGAAPADIERSARAAITPSAIEAPPSTGPQPKVLTPTEISRYLECPFEYAVAHLLRLGPAREASSDLEPAEAGRVAHAALAAFFAERGEELARARGPAAIEALAGRLREAAALALDAHERRWPPLDAAVWRGERAALEEDLAALAAEEVARAEAGAPRPRHFELAFGVPPRVGDDPASTPEPLTFERDGRKVHVGGRIDRLDLSDAHAVVWDYKTGSAPSGSEIRAGEDVQLALYLEAARRLFVPGRELAGGAYYLVRARESRRSRGLFRSSAAAAAGASPSSTVPDEEFEQALSRLEEAVWRAADGIEAGRFDASPRDADACRECRVRHLCRSPKGGRR